MKKAIGYTETPKGFTVTVFDHGYVKMNEPTHEYPYYKICYFATKEEAQKAIDEYNELWRE